MISKLNKIKSITRNTLDKRHELVYVVEQPEWSINWDGRQLTDNLNKLELIRSRTSTTYLGLRNKIIHFGSINTIIDHENVANIDKSNKIILTWFHIIENDKKVKFIPQLLKVVDIFHTASNNTKRKLVGFGIPENKITVIPLGVDLDYFKPMSSDEKNRIKKRLGLPLDKFIIGSFQKDGVGWGKGIEPKLVKGPDIFCDVVEKLSKRSPIFVLLTGPARGYVKKRLEDAKINYKHDYLKNYLDIVDYYNAIDLYLMTSREEGGPKAILESWACGVPIVSTTVGMAPDIINDKQNGMLTQIDDISNLLSKSLNIFEDRKIGKIITNNGLTSVKEFDWRLIASKYYDEIYKKL
ncbi:glycosyltransferase family 4 protein [Patescibacteria group bacterium]|nr:glycosyltransferase family 4 protein [Patescibacteria group bacterium]MBU1952087.1 glycosyltransferase family 4 protein [Patescibacteria group bacterium]